jgi:hypothetical protein
MELAPRLAHFVSLSTPYRGQYLRSGGAGSAVFLDLERLGLGRCGTAKRYELA